MAFLGVKPWRGPSRFSKEGKTVGVNSHIDCRPIAAFGNSEGEAQMLQWATTGQGARFALRACHTNDNREFTYDQGTEQALGVAKTNDWAVVDMKKDRKVIYPTSK